MASSASYSEVKEGRASSPLTREFLAPKADAGVLGHYVGVWGCLELVHLLGWLMGEHGALCGPSVTMKSHAYPLSLFSHPLTSFILGWSPRFHRETPSAPNPSPAGLFESASNLGRSDRPHPLSATCLLLFSTLSCSPSPIRL